METLSSQNILGFFQTWTGFPIDKIPPVLLGSGWVMLAGGVVMLWILVWPTFKQQIEERLQPLISQHFSVFALSFFALFVLFIALSLDLFRTAILTLLTSLFVAIWHWRWPEFPSARWAAVAKISVLTGPLFLSGLIQEWASSQIDKNLYVTHSFDSDRMSQSEDELRDISEKFRDILATTYHEVTRIYPESFAKEDYHKWRTINSTKALQGLRSVPGLRLSNLVNVTKTRDHPAEYVLVSTIRTPHDTRFATEIGTEEEFRLLVLQIALTLLQEVQKYEEIRLSDSEAIAVRQTILFEFGSFLRGIRIQPDDHFLLEISKLSESPDLSDQDVRDALNRYEKKASVVDATQAAKRKAQVKNLTTLAP